MAKIVLPERTIQIPLRLDSQFLPPDLEEAFEFYPTYREQGGEWSFAGYMAWILKQIDAAKPHHGYTGQVAFNDFVAWLGGMPVFAIRFCGLRRFQCLK